MTTASATRPPAARWKSLWRWTCRLLLLAVLAVAAAATIAWWQERPLVQAEAALEEGDLSYALYLLDNFLDKHPEHELAMSLKGRTLVAMRRDAHEAARLFEKAGATDSEGIHAWAQAYLMQEQWTRALPLLTHLAQLRPDDADVLYELTACRVRLRLFPEALESAERLVALDAEDPRFQLFLGSIHYDLGNHQAATEAFARVLEHEPDAMRLQVPPAEFFLQYGRALLESGRPEEALSVLARSILAQPTAEAHTLLGNAAEQVGELQRASELWQAALQIDSQYVPAREALAAEALHRQDGEAALRWLAPLETNPQLAASTAYLFQRTHSMLNHEEAAEHWRVRADQLRKEEQIQSTVANVLRNTPGSFWAHIIRAHQFASEGNWQQAETMIDALGQEAFQEPFVQQLERAIDRRTELPPLRELPIRNF